MDAHRPKGKWPKTWYCLTILLAAGLFVGGYFLFHSLGHGGTKNNPWQQSDVTSNAFNLVGTFQFCPKYVTPATIYYYEAPSIKKKALTNEVVTPLLDLTQAKIKNSTTFQYSNWHVGWDDTTKTEGYVLLQGYYNRTSLVSPTTSVVYVYYPGSPIVGVDIGNGSAIQCCSVDPLSSAVAYVKDGDLWVYNSTTRTSSLVQKAAPNTLVATYPWMIRQEMGDSLAAWWSNGSLLYAQYDLTNVAQFTIDLVQYPNKQQFSYDYPFPGEQNPQVTLTLVHFAPPLTKSWSLGDNYIIQVLPYYDSPAFVVKTHDRTQQNMTISTLSLTTDTPVVIDTATTPTFFAPNATMALTNQKLLDIAQTPNGAKHQSQIVMYDLSQSNQKSVLLSARPGEEITKVVGYVSSPEPAYTFISTLSNQTNPPPAGMERVVWSVNPRYIEMQTVSTTHASYQEAWSNADFSYYIVSDTAYVAGDVTPKTFVYHVGTKDAPLEMTKYTTAAAAQSSVNALASPEWGTDYLHTEPLSEADTVNSVNVAYMKPPYFDKNGHYPVIIAFPDHPGQQLVSVKWPYNTERMRWYAYMCSAHNYVIVLVDAHGADGRGYDFLTSTYEALESEVSDYETVIQTIRSYSWVNRDLVSLMGWNYGAGLALVVATKYNDLVRSLVAVAPQSGWEKSYSFFAERYLGLPGPKNQAYNLSSVYLDIENGKIMSTIALIQGTADTVVHDENAYDFQQIFQKNSNSYATRFYINLDNNLYTGDGAVNVEFYDSLTSFFTTSIKYQI